jgi:hypothetical protein
MSAPVTEGRRHGLAMTGAVLLMALTARLAVVWQRPDFAFHDEFRYFEIAREIARHNRYAYPSEGPGQYSIRQAPGLPMALGLAGKVFELTPVRAKVINALAGWLAVCMLAAGLWRVTRSAPLAAAFAALAGLHPPLVYLDATNYPQPFQALGLSLLVLALLCGERTPGAAPPTPAVGLLHGGLLGGSALFVPTQLFLLPALWMARWTRTRRGAMPYAALSALGFFLVILPWGLRNRIVENAWIPFSTSGGEQFFLGFNENAGMNTGVLVPIPDSLRAALAHTTSGREAEALYRQAGRDWIREHPGRAARLWALKALNFFRWDTGSLATETEQGGAARAWMTRITSLLVFGVWLAGWPSLWRSRRPWAVFTALALAALAAGHAFFIFRYRYRLPFEPLLLWAGLWGLHLGRLDRHKAG